MIQLTWFQVLIIVISVNFAFAVGSIFFNPLWGFAFWLVTSIIVGWMHYKKNLKITGD